jgi:hypothetical protein
VKYKPIHCPECGEIAWGTADTVPGVALFNYFKDGVEYASETQMFWDGQVHEEDPKGRIRLQCREGHTWFARADEAHRCKGRPVEPSR